MHEVTNNEDWNIQKPNLPIFKVDPIVVLILGIVTCGLYLIYWNIKVAEVINAANNREVISQPIAIFSGCCYPVNLYFFWLIGKEGLPTIYNLTNQNRKDESGLLLILGFFVLMAAAMIVQGDINKLYN